MSSVSPANPAAQVSGVQPVRELDLAERIHDSPGRNVWTAEAFLLVIFLVALFSRVLVLIHPADIYLGPAILFDHLGLRMAVGHGFGPTSILPPLYPFYLSLFYKTVGYSHQVILLSQALVGALACSAGALLVRYLGLNRRYAWMAGLLLALFPQSIAQTRHLSPETLLGYLFLAAMVLWTRGRPFPHVGETLAAGLCFGLVLLGGMGAIFPIGFALLARGHFADRMTGTFGYRSPTRTGAARVSPTGSVTGAARVSPPGSVTGSITVSTPSPKRLFRARILHRLLVLVCLLSIGGVWASRNSAVHGRLVLIDSTWALRLRGATIPGTHDIEYRVPGRLVRLPDNSPLTENGIALGEWMGFVATHPGKVAKIWARRGGEFFGFSGRNDVVTLEQFPYAGGAYQLAQAFFWGVALSLALAWVILLRRRGEQERVLSWAVLGCVVLASVSGNVGNARILAFPLVVALAMRGAWGFLVLSGIRIRTPQSEARMIAAGQSVGVEVLPAGVDRVGRLRWIAWLLGVLSIWLHGLSSILVY